MSCNSPNLPKFSLQNIVLCTVVITLIFHTRVINNTMVYDQVNTVRTDESDLEMAQNSSCMASQNVNSYAI